MSFDNENIVKDVWNVIYAKNPYELFEQLAVQIYGVNKDNKKNNVSFEKSQVTQSFSWSFINNNGNVERYSGLNAFYGLGSKNPQGRLKKIENLKNNFHGVIPEKLLNEIVKKLLDFVNKNIPEIEREKIRDEIRFITKECKNETFYNTLIKILYRPTEEVYIPIPKARQFHTAHPSFFVPNITDYFGKTGNLSSPEKRIFNLIFEPSGKKLPSHITQEYGKAIESLEKQTYLGQWILREIFQLKEFEPLTTKKLNEIGINGVRLYKTDNTNNIHLEFIWIDEDNPPLDFWGEEKQL